LSSHLPAPDRLDEAIVSAFREEAARRLELPVEAVKSCVALIPPQPEGQRGYYAFVLAVELLRAGASLVKIAAYIGAWLERCDQPRKANHAFTLRELESTIRSAEKTQETAGLRGYGCYTGPLAELCPYKDAGISNCPYIAHRRKPMRRERINTLLGAFNLSKAHLVPAHWKSQVIPRRRFLYMAFGALEVIKGYAGGELITSLRELEYQTKISRSTLRRDLEAMAAAGWIEFAPGLSRREKRSLPARGACIRRLLPGESKTGDCAKLADVLKAFPGAEIVAEGAHYDFNPLHNTLTPGGNT